MFDRLLEAFDGAVMRLIPLTGQDVSPLRPGEPLPGSAGYASMIAMLDDAQRGLGDMTRGLYPRMTRVELLRLLDEMDNTDLPASVLDMQSEDATAFDHDKGEAITLEGGNEIIREEVGSLFHKLRIEERLFGLCRNMGLYGSEFQRLVYDGRHGVTHMIDTNAPEMEIIVSKDTKEIRGYKEKGRSFRGSNDAISYPFDYAHFKLIGKRYEEPYGQSVLAAGIRAWSQLVLSEDKALLYRMTRHPDRLLFEVDVGGASEAEGYRTLQNYRRSMRKTWNVDKSLQRLFADYNPVGAMEDIWIAKRKESETKVSMLNGSQNVQDVTDLSYYGRKFLASTRTPPPMFGFDDAQSQGTQFDRAKKLANQDIRYARHIIRLQRALCHTLRHIAIIHLRLKAVHVESPLLDYDGDRDTGKGALQVKLPHPSFLAETERLELQQLRGQIATERMTMLGLNPAIDPYEMALWVFKNILKTPSDELHKLVKQPTEQPGMDGPGGPGGPPGLPGGLAGAGPPSLPGGGPPQPKALPSGGGAARRKPPSQNASVNGNGHRNGALHDSRMFNLTNGGELNERQMADFRLLVEKSPKLRHRIMKLAEAYAESQ